MTASFSKNWTRLALAVSLVGIGACASSTSLVGRWSDPAYQGRTGDKVLVVALAENERNAKIWEDSFSRALTAAGAQPIAGSQYIPVSTAADSTAFVSAIERAGASMLAITRLVSAEREQQYVPGYSYYSPAPYYHGYYGYYNSSYAMVHEPGYYVENKVYNLETNLYDVATRKLVWSGLTKTVNPENARIAADEISDSVIMDAVASKVFAKK